MGIKKKHVPGCTCCGVCGPSNHTEVFETDPYPDASGTVYLSWRLADDCVGSVGQYWLWDSTNDNMYWNNGISLSNTSSARTRRKFPASASYFSLSADFSWNQRIFGIGLACSHSRMFLVRPILGDMLRQATGSDSCPTGSATTFGSGVPMSGSSTLKFTVTANGSNWDIEYFYGGSSVATETGVSLTDVRSPDNVYADGCLMPALKLIVAGVAPPDPSATVDNLVWETG